jgi:hypothetical protein
MIKHKDAQGNYPWSPPTNSNPNTSKSKEQGAHENPTKIAQKDMKNTDLQEGNQCNHENFHTLGWLILYTVVKKIYAYGVEMRSSPEGWFAQKP